MNYYNDILWKYKTLSIFHMNFIRIRNNGKRSWESQQLCFWVHLEMFKFFVETLLFVFVIVQIMDLTSYTQKNAPAPAPAPASALQISAAQLEAMYMDTYGSTQYLSDSYAVAGHISDAGILQKLAEKEAQRIVQTGDISSLRTEIEKNSVQLKLLGHNF